MMILYLQMKARILLNNYEKRQALKEKYGNERVLCVDTSKFKYIDDLEAIDGYIKLITLYGTFYYRYDVENDDTKKQIIPYIVLKSGNKYMFAKRLKGDSRLVGGYTIGMGGHVDYSDLAMDGVHIDATNTLENCVGRELNEETTIDLDGILNFKVADCFIDESNDVSKVHACVLYVMELSDTDVTIKETDKLEAQWLTINQITDEMYESMEGWSKIAYKILFGKRKKKTKSEAKREAIQLAAQEVKSEQ